MNLSVDQEAREFQLAAEAFRRVRQQHTAALRGGHLQNIRQWQEERNHVLRRLQTTLDRLIAWLQASGRPDRDEILRGVKTEVAAIIEEEAVLQSAVQQQSVKVSRRLQKMRCGKRGLSAYRSAASGNARPRFLNSKS